MTDKFDFSKMVQDAWKHSEASVFNKKMLFESYAKDVVTEEEECLEESDDMDMSLELPSDSDAVPHEGEIAESKEVKLVEEKTLRDKFRNMVAKAINESVNSKKKV